MDSGRLSTPVMSPSASELTTKLIAFGDQIIIHYTIKNASETVPTGRT
jgi:hypothetical protein